MNDGWEIQQVLNRYTDGSTRRAFDQVMATFLPDGVWEIEGVGLFTGTAEILAAFTSFAATSRYIVQINAPAVIAVEGDRARTRSSICEFGRYLDRDVGFQFVGTYHDELERTPAGWRFRRRRYVNAGLSEHDLHPATGATSIARG